jgi:hypothetical protein
LGQLLLIEVLISLDWHSLLQNFVLYSPVKSILFLFKHQLLQAHRKPAFLPGIALSELTGI